MKTNNEKSISTLIVLGSGGHTTEMLRLLSGTDLNIYKPRIYAIAATDTMSTMKMKEFEANKLDDIDVSYIYRSRHVGQSYLTSILTTLWAFFTVIPLVYRAQPKLVTLQTDILVNGPGTCIPIVLASLLLSIVFLVRRPKIVFVESICRVETLSLSGKILRFLPVEILVQWPQLTEIYPKTKYIGRLI